MYYSEIRYPVAMGKRGFIYHRENKSVFCNFQLACDHLSRLRGLEFPTDELWSTLSNYNPNTEVFHLTMLSPDEFAANVEDQHLNPYLNPEIIQIAMDTWILDDENSRPCPVTENQLVILLSAYMVGLLPLEILLQEAGIDSAELETFEAVLELLAEQYHLAALDEEGEELS